MKRSSTVWAALAVVVAGGTGTSAPGAVLPLSEVALAKVEGLRATALAARRPYVFEIVGDEVTDLSPAAPAGTALPPAGGAVPLTATPAKVFPFGSSTTNAIAGPVTYTFLFGSPITPGFYSSATLTAGVTLTNGESGSAAVTTAPTIYPTYVSGSGTLGLATTNLGLDLGTDTVTASGDPGQVTAVKNFGTSNASFAPAFYDGIEVLLTYNQLDLSSVSSWSGAMTISTPEPATIGLIGMGIMALAPRRRGRRPVGV